MQTYIHNLADPKVPQEDIFEQRRHTIATNSCSVHLVWNSPADTDLEYLSSYMVYINGKNVANKTENINESSNLFALLLYCAPYNVSLRAVNRCDRASNSTPDVTVVPKNFLYSEFTGDVYPTTDAGGPPATESQINGKFSP